MNDTTNSPIFITVRPDWSQQVTVLRTFQTAVMRARDGTEQRQGRIMASKITLSYQTTAMTPPEAFAREVQVWQELRSRVVVPLWPYAFPLLAQSGDAFTLPDFTGAPFRVNGFYFIEDTILGPRFQTFRDMNPGAGYIASNTADTMFTLGSLIYPCIEGIRKDGTSTFTTRQTDNSEDVEVDEL